MSEAQPPAANIKPNAPGSGVRRTALPKPEDVEIIPARKHRTKNTIQDVHAALCMFNGDRTKAAEHLHISRPALDNRIHYNGSLRAQWGKLAGSIKERVDDKLTKDPATAIENLVQEQQIALTARNQVTLNQLKRLEERIERGEKALLAKPSDPDYNDVIQFAFKLNDKGEPSEERMLREQYLALLEEHRATTKTCTEQLLIQAKVMKEMRGGNSGNRPNSNRPGFKPKGTQIVAQTVHVHEGSKP